MPDKMKIVNAILLLTVADSYRVHRKNKRINQQLLDENVSLLEKLAHTGFMVGYLANKLDEHEIEIDSFDLIVLNNPM